MIGDDDDCENDLLILKMSQILENCKSYSTSEFNSNLSKDLEKYGGSLFVNIDGNKSNFDHLTVELEILEHKFPIIGIAETNIHPDESSVYITWPVTTASISQPWQIKPKGQVLHSMFMNH